MNKKELRSHFLERRKEIDLDIAHRKSIGIANTFFEQVVLSGEETIHTFLPILKNNEVDTWLIINRLKTKYPEITIVAPRTDFKTNSMTHYVIDKETEIKLNKFGIPEPQNGQIIEENQIDVVLTPLLVVDKQNYRVGYGGGFYDRFFKKCKKETLKIGLGFFEPIQEISDINDLDVKLDLYIRE